MHTGIGMNIQRLGVRCIHAGNFLASCPEVLRSVHSHSLPKFTFLESSFL